MSWFITFEGIDGCGKSTQAALLADHFERLGRRVLHTFEPGATPLGREIREIFLKGGKGELDPTTETLLMAADRAHHVHAVIRAALMEGTVVICERYTDSMEAYQGYGDKISLDVVRALNEIATGGLTPDVTFLLDLPPEIALARKGTNPDRIEARGFRFHQDVRQGYLELSKRHQDRIAVLDACNPAEQIHERIVKHLEDRGVVSAVTPSGGSGA